MSAIHHVDVLTARTKANGHGGVTLQLHIPLSADPQDHPGWEPSPAAVTIRTSSGH